MGLTSKYFKTVVLFSNQSLFSDSYLFFLKSRLATFSWNLYKKKRGSDVIELYIIDTIFEVFWFA